jgi:hypothetical protein
VSTGIVEVIGFLITGKDVVDLIEEVFSEDKSMIRKLADVHRESALQAIEAARRGNYERHMSVALGHLRDTYNALCKSAQRKPNFWERINEESGPTERLRQARDAYKEAVELAAMISRTHSQLGEKRNAKQWAATTNDTFEKYILACEDAHQSWTSGGSPYAGGSGGSYREWKEAPALRAEQRKLMKTLGR